MRGRFGDWPVGAEAIRAGADAYADAGWRTRTLARLTQDAARLDGLLAAAGFEILGGTALFRLACAADAPRRFDRLCRHGVLTRPFPHEPTWLRFGLPDTAGWARLESSLKSLLEVSP